MILLLNKDNVIIDMVEQVKYVKKNELGITQLCHAHDAQGVLSSDENTIYSLLGKDFKPDFTDIASWVIVESVPAHIEPRTYTYSDGAFLVNDNPYPDTATNLTQKTSDLVDAILELSEIIYA